AASVRVRRLVRAGWRGADGTIVALAGDAGAVRGLSRLRLCRDADLAPAADRPSAAARARTMDVPDQQNQSRRLAVCPFSGAGGDHRATVAARLAGPRLAVAAAADIVRPALAGNLLPWRVS